MLTFKRVLRSIENTMELFLYLNYSFHVYGTWDRSKSFAIFLNLDTNCLGYFSLRNRESLSANSISGL